MHLVKKIFILIVVSIFYLVLLKFTSMLINFCNSFNQFAGDEMINSKLLSIILYSSTTIVYVLIF